MGGGMKMKKNNDGNTSLFVVASLPSNDVPTATPLLVLILKKQGVKVSFCSQVVMSSSVAAFDLLKLP